MRMCAILIFLCGLSCCIVAQTDPAQMKQLTANYRIAGKELNSVSEVNKFYELRQYSPAWISNRPAALEMIQLMQNAETLGLDTTHYHLHALNTFLSRHHNSQEDSFYFEMRLTDAAIHFLKDVAYGSAPPVVGYNGIGYVPKCFDIPAALSKAADNGTLSRLIDILQPASAEYNAIKAMLNQLQQMVAQPLFKDERVTSATVAGSNKPLLKRIYQIGILDSVPANIPDTALKTHVKQAQRLFSLVPDGKIGGTFLKELNAPLQLRITELKLALNTTRWLSCARASGSMIVVNIPSATLLVYETENVILQSRIIVGKKSTRTPTLISKAGEVILYPYWMVPKSIATKELLPLIKRNPGYLDANAMQVLNQQGRVVNPYSISWSELSASNFPYVLRQSTGCDNSLGLVKINFYNPYNVYLHDTPWKTLFAANKRYFSHGCMRVERAMELAHLLLAGNTIAVDTLEDKGCLRNQSPIIVPATVPMSVFVLYNTAWVDSAAIVRFNEDVYGRLPSIKK